MVSGSSNNQSCVSMENNPISGFIKPKINSSSCLPLASLAKIRALTAPAKTTAAARTRAATTVPLKVVAAKLKMDEARPRPRRPLGARVASALESCFPVAFSVTFFLTIVLFHCCLL
ncbi:uncharacterized protein LOC134747465 [Cydia strobilella]|uniref:uncharacterized protein LOC134747465 n=1 Tax=Cydia strobilella TaxID=1100964 RepID=UPI003004D596